MTLTQDLVKNLILTLTTEFIDPLPNTTQRKRVKKAVYEKQASWNKTTNRTSQKAVSKQLSRNLKDLFTDSVTYKMLIKLRKYMDPSPKADTYRDNFNVYVMIILEAPERDHQAIREITNLIIEGIDDIFWKTVEEFGGIDLEKTKLASVENHNQASHEEEKGNQVTEAPRNLEQSSPVLKPAEELRLYESREILASVTKEGVPVEDILKAVRQIEALKTPAMSKHPDFGEVLAEALLCAIKASKTSSEKNRILKKLEDLRNSVLRRNEEVSFKISASLYEASLEEKLPITKQRYAERIDRIRRDTLIANKEVAIMVIKLLCDSVSEEPLSSKVEKTISRIDEICLESRFSPKQIADIISDIYTRLLDTEEYVEDCFKVAERYLQMLENGYKFSEDRVETFITVLMRYNAWFLGYSMKLAELINRYREFGFQKNVKITEFLAHAYWSAFHATHDFNENSKILNRIEALRSEGLENNERVTIFLVECIFLLIDDSKNFQVAQFLMQKIEKVLAEGYQDFTVLEYAAESMCTLATLAPGFEERLAFVRRIEELEKSADFETDGLAAYKTKALMACANANDASQEQISMIARRIDDIRSHGFAKHEEITQYWASVALKSALLNDDLDEMLKTAYLVEAVCVQGVLNNDEITSSLCSLLNRASEKTTNEVLERNLTKRIDKLSVKKRFAK